MNLIKKISPRDCREIFFVVYFLDFLPIMSAKEKLKDDKKAV